MEDNTTKVNESTAVTTELIHSTENEELSGDEKCYDVPVVYCPFDGATSFEEMETAQEAMEYSSKVYQFTDQMRGIIHNITMNEEISADEKAKKISDAAEEYRKRVNTTSK